MRFKGKVAFITGGAAGFGKEFAHRLAAEGASIVIVDIDGNGAESTAEALVTKGHKALGLSCDVTQRDQVDRAVSKVREAFGGIDILINNAGLHSTRYNRPFKEMPTEDLAALFNVNVIGVANCSTACCDLLRKRRGVIVNIASMAGHMNTTPYGVSKLAVRGLTTAFASEFAADGIRVNAISPGLVRTEYVESTLSQEMKDYVVNDLQLIHRDGAIDDIVSALLFLCSSESGFITGETIKVTGGYPLFI